MPLYLRDVANAEGGGPYAELITRLRAEKLPVPQLAHMFAYKPDQTVHLLRFTQAVMRGPSPLSPGQRELIAAFVSRRNQCVF